jgi:hypothetical protein
MTKSAVEKLEEDIETLVRAHVAAARAAATAAVERAFAQTAKRSMASEVKALTPRVTKRKDAWSQQKWGLRRGSVEVAALAERLYVAVQANPGETMTLIAPHVGVSVRALNLPMQILKRSGRVRTAGQRASMRYFPMQPKATSSTRE